jgi:EAL domain-containing protein (putative c-di-GMP-specific phosphodiesterase class I)/GGDEF domain-containing protein
MDYLSRKTTQLKHQFLWLFLLLSLVFPAHASNGSFSFIEYNIAFVLGLSLPLILLSALIARRISIKWPFAALLTLAAISIFYSIAYLTKLQTHFLLTSSSLFLSLLYLWPFYNQTEQSLDTLSLRTRLFAKLTIVISAVIFNVTIWFMPQLNAFTSWLLFSAVVLFVAFIRLLSVIRNKNFSSGRLIAQWIITCFFSAAVYLWLNTQTSAMILAMTCVLAYLSTLINGCWFLVQYIYEALADSHKEHKQQITENLFTYTHDPATHLPNFQQALAKFEHKLKADAKNRFAVIILKPINFQQVNSVLGHHNSDILLLQLAYSLQQFVADNSLLLDLDDHETPIRLARLQGLNFLLVCDLSTNHHPDQSVIDDLCQKIALSVPNAMSFKSFSLNFELAFGVAISGTHGNSVAELVAHAGDALLEARNSNKQIHYYDNSNSIHTELQLAKMEALKEDIANEHLHWLIEPQIQQSTKKIIGLELTVAWQYQQNEMQSLAEFRKIAELSGELYVLTKLMIIRAFKTLMVIQKLGIYQPVTINMSSTDLLEPDLGDFIEKQVKKFHIPAKYLMISLNEDIVVNASTRTKAMIDQLKALDLTIAINDFSGSYEALRYLRRMAINQVKINCENLVDHIENATDKAIINALINLTRKMNLPLVGTQIDSQQIETAFVAMGGDFIQGKIVSKNISDNEIATWLQGWFQQYPSVKP